MSQGIDNGELLENLPNWRPLIIRSKSNMCLPYLPPLPRDRQTYPEVTATEVQRSTVVYSALERRGRSADFVLGFAQSPDDMLRRGHRGHLTTQFHIRKNWEGGSMHRTEGTFQILVVLISIHYRVREFLHR